MKKIKSNYKLIKYWSNGTVNEETDFTDNIDLMCSVNACKRLIMSQEPCPCVDGGTLLKIVYYIDDEIHHNSCKEFQYILLPDDFL